MDLIQGLGIHVHAGCVEDVEITSITEDSRTVRPGALFIARPGATFNGRDFIQDAVEAGASAVLTGERLVEPLAGDRAALATGDVSLAAARLAERFFGEPGSALELIGVTGTNGKTTVAHLVREILCAVGSPCGFIGTTGVADVEEMAPATMTTPGPIELSRMLAKMRDAGCGTAAIEVSSHALHQRRTAGLRFGVGVFTNLSGDHLDYHGDMDAYASAKALLFESLDPDAMAIVNADDAASARMIEKCAAPALLCSLNESESVASPEHCFAAEMEFTIDGLRADLVGPWGAMSVKAPLIGRHNAMNLLQAAAACHALGLARASIKDGIGSVTAPPGRLEPVAPPRGATGPRVFVDYAHTDDALAKTLDALRPLAPSGGRLIVVFGCGGDRDRTKRPRMGRIVAERADFAFITSDNPRTEDPEAIIDQIAAGASETLRARIQRNADREEAIGAAICEAGPADVVVIAGKGHEDYQILPDGRGGVTRRRFVDREAAASALEKRASAGRDGAGATRVVAT